MEGKLRRSSERWLADFRGVTGSNALRRPSPTPYGVCTFKYCAVIAQSFQNREVVRGALTLTVSPEVALAALGEP